MTATLTTTTTSTVDTTTTTASAKARKAIQIHQFDNWVEKKISTDDISDDLKKEMTGKQKKDEAFYETTWQEIYFAIFKLNDIANLEHNAAQLHKMLESNTSY